VFWIDAGVLVSRGAFGDVGEERERETYERWFRW
jgi:hypothetical protein